ncbi:Hypothetical protein PHPALM_37889 [Phytophthora palmivora]|uniref:CCHC-type domain-containing protein n=1 Tax=Phytophthora palmivora TaxID=4796 RepID=A0A2P4WW97_9STRA|nr:Hypothetical protein PHPALM_37889 [Phytophthora palmivora]
MSELKEFAVKEGDEDRARTWLNKAKSAFVRDLPPDEEKCLVFGDLLTGSARNWYRQLSRTTRSTWKDFLRSFQIQYCGRGVSVARQYYHARKRSDESPLEYLYRLKVTGSGPASRPRMDLRKFDESVEHFIETIDDRDLADHLALLRIPDADTLEEALRSRQRAKARQSKVVYGSIKPRQKNNSAAVPSASTRAVRAVKAISDSCESEEDSGGSDGKAGLRRVYFAASGNNKGQQDQDQRNQDRSRSEAGNNRVPQDRLDIGSPPKRFSHCGSRKHSDLWCWGRLTCEKCGRKGHPSDRCIFTCKACGDIHEAGKCTMEEFYNLIRQCVMTALAISPGESRGYWKYHVPDKKFKQPKAMGKINSKKSTLLFDSGAEVSIQDATFARKVGCHIDESQTLECEGVGRSPYKIEGRTRLKITLAGSLVYFFGAWVGPPTGGQDLILGMDFMVPAGIRLDLADGTICLPDEVRLQMAGRRPLYGDKVEHVCWKGHYWIDVGQTAEIRLRSQTSNQYKLWVTRGDRWVPTITVGLGRTRYLQVINVSDRALTLHEGLRVAMWLSGDRIPRISGYVSVGSRRYAEWQNLAYQATTDEIGEAGTNEQITEPMVERPEYVTPTAILPRPVKAIHNVKIAGNGDASPPSIECTSDQGKIGPANSNDLRTKVAAEIGDPTMDDEVCIKEGGSLFAEDVEDQMAVLPEMTATTEEVKIEDLQIGDANINTQEEIERLVQIIWKRKHLLIGKGNALPPAAKGVVCDIDVGNAKPLANVAPRWPYNSAKSCID